MKQGIANLVYMRDGWQCRHCRNRNGIHPHHVIFRSQGGSDDLTNLITLCAVCHAAVHEGRLDMVIISIENNNLRVHFTRIGGWKPS